MNRKKTNKNKSVPSPSPLFYVPRPDGKVPYFIDPRDPKAREAAAKLIADQAIEESDARRAAGGPVFNPDMPDEMRRTLERLAQSSNIIVPGFSKVKGPEEEFEKMQEALRKKDEEKKENGDGSPPKFKNSKLQQCPPTDKIGEHYNNGVFYGNYKDIGDLVPNFAMFPDDFEGRAVSKFYILNDLDRSREPPTEAFLCLTNILRHFPDKKLYLRTLSPICNGIIDKRVVAEEVLEMLPLVLRQQKSRISYSDPRLFLLHQMHQPKPYRKYHIYSTMGMEELQLILEEFDVNKNLITLIDDKSFEQGQRRMHEDGETEIPFVNYSGEKSMLISQAIRHVFHSLVYGVHWEKDQCVKHENCLEQFRKMVLFVMREYAEFDENYLIAKDIVDGHIQKLKSHCAFVLQKNLPERQLLVHLKETDRRTYTKLQSPISNVSGIHENLLQIFQRREDSIDSDQCDDAMFQCFKVAMFEWEEMNEYMRNEMKTFQDNGQNDSNVSEVVHENNRFLHHVGSRSTAVYSKMKTPYPDISV
ncbi:hypothetical protein GCK72_011011 [Caenorhabditis remanei]|uniref:Uncharacterized protein n=1 Tax=Caenorhabditis remanei TaxID=31234 RepID=A0A6A5H6R5_CAERE|nr:hypothetical protein GCK72_011011 [Caenorhabditis remanei]KAF1762749.1 hypothetical protein GCK72_011011 [Caenorhabditis remanei]